jgi:hypothetical protein
MTVSDMNVVSNMNDLVRDAWQVYCEYENQPFVVKPSIPILFFGDSQKYSESNLKVITLGLNPSRIEFPDADRFLRFNAARNVYPHILEGRYYEDYLTALNQYFLKPPNHPYAPWFSSFEHLLKGLDCSYYGLAPNTALHTDLCSPLATDPTWSKLPRESRDILVASGARLWHLLAERLSPDLIVASIARHHLDRITFPRLHDWRRVYTVERTNPYQIEVAKLRISSGKVIALVFGRAANTPFGTVSKADKRRIGIALKEHVYGE